MSKSALEATVLLFNMERDPRTLPTVTSSDFGALTGGAHSMRIRLSATQREELCPTLLCV